MTARKCKLCGKRPARPRNNYCSRECFKAAAVWKNAPLQSGGKHRFDFGRRCAACGAIVKGKPCSDFAAELIRLAKEAGYRGKE